MAFTTKEIRDVETLRAIAHPLRMTLLGALRRNGPATSSELGRELGESSGSTSYHLRQLERFGFVVEDDVQPSGRERRWKAAHEMTSFPDDLWTTAEGRELFDDVRSRQFEHLKNGLAAWTGPRRGFGHSDYSLHLDPADLEALEGEISDVIGRYAAHTGSETVSLHVLALPVAPS
ncbi:MAG: helix-turn-helix domain-containing protein [Actinomycetota bacterium]|nr:helix-turn-helix domain-containing protein [Actinomycetota bacterium]